MDGENTLGDVDGGFSVSNMLGGYYGAGPSPMVILIVIALFVIVWWVAGHPGYTSTASSGSSFFSRTGGKYFSKAGLISHYPAKQVGANHISFAYK